MLFKKILKSWLFEFILGLIVLSGVVYAFNVESFNKWFIEGFLNVSKSVTEKSSGFLGFIFSKTGLKYIGVALVGFFALVVIVWRIIWRIQGSKKLASTSCPNCDEPLVRVKSKDWMKLIRKILPVRRFYCRKCGWKGLRIKGSDYAPLNVQAGKPTSIHIDKIS